MRPRSSKPRDNDGYQLRVPQDLPLTASWRLWARQKLMVTMPQFLREQVERQKMIAEMDRRAAIARRAEAEEREVEDLEKVGVVLSP